MHKYSLRFKNRKLELAYRQYAIAQIRHLYIQIQVSLCFTQLVFAIQNIIFEDTHYAMIFYGLLLASNLLFTWLGIKKIPAKADKLLFIQNLMLNLTQIVYLYPMRNLKFFQFSSDTHQSFVAGTILTVVNISLIVGPDFVENCIHIFTIFLMKTVLAFLTNQNSQNVLLLLSAFFFMNCLYHKHIVSRNHFMDSQREYMRDFILEEGFDDSLVCCQVERLTTQIKLIKCNVSCTQRHQIRTTKDLQLFLRQIILIEKCSRNKKITLEKWLWEDSFKQDTYQSLKSRSLDCYKESDEKRLYMKVKILRHDISTGELSLIFSDISSVSHLELLLRMAERNVNNMRNILKRQNRINLQLYQNLRQIIKSNGPALYQYVKNMRMKCFHLAQMFYQLNLDTLQFQQLKTVQIQSLSDLIQRSTHLASKAKTYREYQTTIFINQNWPQEFVTCIPMILHLHLLIIEFLGSQSIGDKTIEITQGLCYEDNLLMIDYIYQKDNSLPEVKYQLKQRALRNCASKVLNYIGLYKELRMTQISFDKYKISFVILDQKVIVNQQQENLMIQIA